MSGKFFVVYGPSSDNPFAPYSHATVGENTDNKDLAKRLAELEGNSFVIEAASRLSAEQVVVCPVCDSFRKRKEQ